MHKGLNFSVYMSEAQRQLPLLEQILPRGSYVFTSFHIAEEVDDNYRTNATEICRRLKDGGYRIVADVSARTLKTFGVGSLEQFADLMGIDLLRIDYGFSDEELIALANRRSIVINCSTLSGETAVRLGAAPNQIYGLHNFYPRPETGLDGLTFKRMNQRMKGAGIEPMAFIAGDILRRGPVYAGLPTLEAHRDIPPYVAYLELAELYGVKGIFVGDGLISAGQHRLVEAFCSTGVLQIPAVLDEGYHDLFDRVFTVRVDSPLTIARFAESREYATAIPNLSIAPCNCSPREIGCITIDNREYGRYQGEIQLMRTTFEADRRVNVIGKMSTKYNNILSVLNNGCSFTLVNALAEDLL